MKKITPIIVFTIFCIVTNAQNILDKTTFTAPSKLVMAKGTRVNVREKANIKAPLIVRWFDEDEKEVIHLNAGTLAEVIEENDGWYYVKFPFDLYGVEPGFAWGYVSKTVTEESAITPMEGISTGFMKYKGNEFEYITETGSTRFPCLYVTGRLDSEASSYRFQDTDHSVNLWLGQKVGDILVFKYPAFTVIKMKPNYNGKDLIDTEGTPQITFGSTVTEGLNWYPLDKENGMLCFDFSNYGDKELEAIFSQAIKAQLYMKQLDKDYVSPAIYINANRLRKGW